MVDAELSQRHIWTHASDKHQAYLFVECCPVFPSISHAIPILFYLHYWPSLAKVGLVPLNIFLFHLTICLTNSAAPLSSFSVFPMISLTTDCYLDFSLTHLHL